MSLCWARLIAAKQTITRPARRKDIEGFLPGAHYSGRALRGSKAEAKVNTRIPVEAETLTVHERTVAGSRSEQPAGSMLRQVGVQPRIKPQQSKAFIAAIAAAKLHRRRARDALEPNDGIPLPRSFQIHERLGLLHRTRFQGAGLADEPQGFVAAGLGTDSM